jgi:glycerate kinase
MLPAAKYHPFELDTFGLGKVIEAAAAKRARRCFIGIGGSATNDGGFGLARALGWGFFDARGNRIQRWTALTGLARVRRPRKRTSFDELVVAVDVQNPLLGRRGATRIYGPQKGLLPRDFVEAERALRRIAAQAPAVARTPGAGAAGGLGFGLAAFLGGRLEAGFQIFSKQSCLEQNLLRADIVITGEGRLDASSFMGKAVGEVARRCQKLGIPCIAIAGAINDRDQTCRLFQRSHALTNLISTDEALNHAQRWLIKVAASAATELDPEL